MESQRFTTSLIFDSVMQILDWVSLQNSLLLGIWYIGGILLSRPSGFLAVGQSHRFVPFALRDQFFGLRDLRFHLPDKLRQLCLTLTLSASVNVPGIDLTVRPFGGISSLPQVVVDLRQAASPPFSVLALVWLESGFPACFSPLGG